MSDLDYYPENYADARRRFRQWQEKVTGPKETARWPIENAAGDDLTVDTLYLPPTKEPQKLFIILSGVHGLEAYAGHGIQTLFMQEFLPNIDRRFTGIYLIHSLNPYGFKHHTRGTENGVNLNRNCSVSNDLYKIKNFESIRLSEKFVPECPVDDQKSYLLKKMRQENEQIFFDDVTLDHFIKAVGLGQFKSAGGLEYGGHGPEPQIKKMIEVLSQLMPFYKDIVLLDLHTGLGERGRLHLLTGDVPGCVHPKLFAEIFNPPEDKSIYAFTPADDQGFYKTYGATNNIFPELIKPNQRVCAMTMEFGTLGHDLPAQLKSLDQWLLEHQGSLYGYESDELESKIKADYLEKFFPASPQWRQKVIDTSRAFFNRILKRAKVLF